MIEENKICSGGQRAFSMEHYLVMVRKLNISLIIRAKLGTNQELSRCNQTLKKGTCMKIANKGEHLTFAKSNGLL